MLRSYILVLAAVLLLLGCITPAPSPENETVINETNQSGQLNENGQPNQTINDGLLPNDSAPLLPPDYTVNLGDRIWVNYTLWVDGEVYDTNNPTLANESGIYNPYRKYEPFVFTVEFHKGVIDGFVINVIGMSINETVTFSVDPDRGYGPYDPNKVITVARYYEKSLSEVIPRSYLENRGINISKGAGFDSSYGTVFIEDFNDENVTIFYVLTPGARLTVAGVPQKVVSLSNLTATIEFDLAENETYVLPHPDTGAPANFLIKGKTNDTIILDANHPLANETLRFEVTLIDAIPAQNPG